MSVRYLPKSALIIVTLAACTAPDRRSAPDTSAMHDTTAARASADSIPVSTHDMVEALSRDVRTAQRDLAAKEESLYVFVGTGDSTALLLKKAHASWEQYRKLECDAIRVAFGEGSMAPVAQMECWIDLTDDHRKFIGQEYDYMRNGGPPASGRSPR